MGNAAKFKWLIAWDFHKKPRRTFYEIYVDEFRDAPELQHLQRSVVLAQDDFTARRLRALLTYYGADVCAFAVNGHNLDSDQQANHEANEFVVRVHAQRLSRRGRRRA